MSEIKRKERPTNGNGEKSYTPLNPQELAARQAKWEVDRLVEEARCRLKGEYERAWGKYPYSVSPGVHDTLHFRTSTAINNLLTERATVREIEAVTAVLREVPTGSVFSDSSSSELERRVKAALAAVRAQIANEPRVIPEPPAIEVAPAPIASETREEKARRLFAEGASVRAVARETGFSIGKTHQLKQEINNGNNEESQGRSGSDRAVGLRKRAC